MILEDISLTVGGQRLEELLIALAEHKVQLNAHAPLYFLHPGFQLSPSPWTATVRLLTPAELGFGDPTPFPELARAAEAQGLALCPPEVGPYLRLALIHQEESRDTLLTGAHRAPQGAIHVMSPRLDRRDNFPRGLYLRNVAGLLWLRGYVCDEAYPFPTDALLAFLVK